MGRAPERSPRPPAHGRGPPSRPRARRHRRARGCLTDPDDEPALADGGQDQIEPGRSRDRNEPGPCVDIGTERGGQGARRSESSTGRSAHRRVTAPAARQSRARDRVRAERRRRTTPRRCRHACRAVTHSRAASVASESGGYCGDEPAAACRRRANRRLRGRRSSGPRACAGTRPTTSSSDARRSVGVTTVASSPDSIDRVDREAGDRREVGVVGDPRDAPADAVRSAALRSPYDTS